MLVINSDGVVEPEIETVPEDRHFLVAATLDQVTTALGAPDRHAEPNSVATWTIQTSSGRALLIDHNACLTVNEVNEANERLVQEALTFNLYAASEAVTPWVITAIHGNCRQLATCLPGYAPLEKFVNSLTGYAHYLFWQTAIATRYWLNFSEATSDEDEATALTRIAVLYDLASRTAQRAGLHAQSRMDSQEYLAREREARPTLPRFASETQIDRYCRQLTAWWGSPSHLHLPVTDEGALRHILRAGAAADRLIPQLYKQGAAFEEVVTDHVSTLLGFVDCLCQ
ncbi:hypothetical protein M8C13_07475 [Crossiella sp. SN42]|uniref:hypothetical protein n=1 Tax=Crossiella sp. SN42 TaxID=2944808 RepID=UPI00207CF697|nr:hypothetical protein [Crossiella sp. SN42]MCO1575597.1 hypothetical protein [Crossiella sp. SN42]